MGLDYVKTKFSTKYSKFVPMASIGVGMDGKSLNVVYVPKRFGANEKESFLFFFYQIDFKN